MTDRAPVGLRPRRVADPGAGVRAARSRRPSRGRAFARGLAGVLVLVVVFQVVSSVGIVDQAFLPAFSTVVVQMVESLGSAPVWVAIGSTLAAWAAGMAIAVVIAVPLGIVFGLSTTSYRASRAIIELVRPMPAVALIPLALLAIGPGVQLKLFVATFASVWPILFNTISGVHGVDRRATEMARTFGQSRFQVIRRVVIPAAMPFAFAGVRLSSAIVLIVIITVELIAGGSEGLGSYIASNEAAGDHVPLVYSGILLSGVLGLAINLLLGAVERRAFAWNVRAS